MVCCNNKRTMLPVSAPGLVEWCLEAITCTMPVCVREISHVILVDSVWEQSKSKSLRGRSYTSALSVCLRREAALRWSTRRHE